MPADLVSALVLAQKALSLARRHPYLMTPRNQQVLFRFLADADATTRTRIDRALAEEGLSQKLFDEMGRSVLDPGEQSAALSEIGAGLEGEVGQVLALVSEARNSTHDYGDSLKSTGGQFAGLSDQSGLMAAVSSIVAASERMEQTAAELEERLAESSHQIEELNTRLVDLRNQATIDPLTEIINRRHFEERLRDEIQSADETGGDLCLCVADIDHFKKFNDTHGHQIGDQVLRLVAHALAKSARDSDVVARYGGEEFAILLPDTPLETALDVADRMRKTIREKPLVKRSSGEELGGVTISFGVARYRAGEPPDDLIHRADLYLYQAKRAGRDLVVSEGEVAADAGARTADGGLSFAQ